MLFVPWYIQIAYLNSTTPKPYHIRWNWQYITYRTEICAFVAFLCKFGCYGNSLCSPEIFISIFEFSDPENLTIHANIVSIAFNWTEICGILVYSYIILVAMATPLAPLKFWIAYLKSPTPKTLPYTQNLCRYLVQKWSYAYLNVWRIFTIADMGNFVRAT